MSITEVLSLSDSEKLSLAQSLLAEFGARNIHSPTSDGEIIHSCTLTFGLHRNGDAHPSASLNYKKLVYNCLASETLVKTYYGEMPIGDLVGREVKLLDGDGHWVDSEIRSFGIQPLMRVTLKRNGVARVIYATPDHRWLKRRKSDYSTTGRNSKLQEVRTQDLKPKDRIPSVWPMVRTGRTTLSSIGVAHGFVYGDGTSSYAGSIARFLNPEKDYAMMRFYSLSEVSWCKNDRLVMGGYHEVRTGLPRSWKELPSLDEGPSYLYGFLAGWFAADGCVDKDGAVSLACADRDALRHAIAIGDRLGIMTYTLAGKERLHDFPQKEYQKESGSSWIYQLSFRTSSMPEDFFLIEEHRKRVEKANARDRRKYERTNWWVSSVEETDRVEEVYCAIVPTTHSFVLESNILTGNCLGCSSSGGLLWWIGICRGTSTDSVAGWLAKQAGLDGNDTASVLKYIEAAYNPTSPIREPIPRYSPKVLDLWRWVHPYMTEIRRIPFATLVKFQVGYAEKFPVGESRFTERVIIPHFWKGDLVGWQARRMYDDGLPKYLNSTGFPKDETIFNYDPSKEAVVTEGAMSVLAQDHLQYHCESTFSATVTKRQITLLANHPKVTLFFDNDSAGWKATRQVGEELSKYTMVYVAHNLFNADPADFAGTDIYFEAAVDQAVPLSIWDPPKELIPYEPDGDQANYL